MNKETKQALKIIKNSPEIKKEIKFYGLLTAIVIFAGLAGIRK